RGDGALSCWGNNFGGQLGNGTFDAADAPRPVSTDRLFRAVSVGAYQTCAIDTEDRLWCWGGVGVVPQTYGELRGAGPATPTRVGTDGDWAEVALGAGGGCGLRHDGAVGCWAVAGPDAGGSLDEAAAPVLVRI